MCCRIWNSPLQDEIVSRIAAVQGAGAKPLLPSGGTHGNVDAVPYDRCFPTSNRSSGVGHGSKTSVEAFLCPSTLLENFDNDGLGASRYMGCAGTDVNLWQQ